MEIYYGSDIIMQKQPGEIVHQENTKDVYAQHSASQTAAYQGHPNDARAQ